MARMHSRKKGKSGSKKPVNKTYTWMSYKPKEIELLVLKLAKEGKSASEAGIILRDTYGIPDIKSITKKSVSAYADSIHLWSSASWGNCSRN